VNTKEQIDVLLWIVDYGVGVMDVVKSQKLEKIKGYIMVIAYAVRFKDILNQLIN